MATALMIVGCLSSALARGQEAAAAPAAAEELPVRKLVVVPAAEPDPPLRYIVTPAFGDLQPGNAAANYYRAVMLLPKDNAVQFGDTQQSWIDMSLAELPREEVRKWLAVYRNSLEEVRVATFRETCDWNHRVRELKRLDPIMFLLPELQEMRTVSRVLRVKARLEIAEGRFDDARATLTMGYRLATNVTQSPTLISHLVGVAIGATMNACVIDWIEAGGPNLYWALADLPTPLVDIRPALQQEMNLPLQMFPFLTDPEHADHSAEQWRTLLAESMQLLTRITNESGETANLAAQSLATGLILAEYPAAKQQLIESGMDAATVEAMPVGQVVAIQSARAYRKVYQESLKWTLLPYWQAREPMRAAFAQLESQGFLKTSGKIPCALPIAPFLLPAIEAATLAPIRMQRELAALQTIEALRMAAARGGTNWPPSLHELSPFAPAPLDPLTGGAMDYTLVEAGIAVLTLAPPPGQSPPSTASMRYEIELKK
jgi:hypothetical protein